MKIILASASPRRKELLGLLNIPFEIMESNADENINITDPVEMTETLSGLKAKSVYDSLRQNQNEKYLVIGSDTVVFIPADKEKNLPSKILGKPSSKEDARQMIKLISGRSHIVCTGVTIIYPLANASETDSPSIPNENNPKESSLTNSIENNPKEPDPANSIANATKVETFSNSTKVFVKNISDKEIEDYLKLDEAYDKAGAYGIQGSFSKFIEKIEGDYFNVVGLPVSLLYDKLKNILY